MYEYQVCDPGNGPYSALVGRGGLMRSRFVRFATIMTISTGLGVTCSDLQGQQEKSAQPDNTKTNKRDRNKAEQTADQAKETMSDRDIMQRIRKSVVEDKSLSSYAHNIKIISEHGKVTLKGPVHSEVEKSTIAAKAAAVAGEANVRNELTVKGDTGRKSTH
jgi:hyperosmotically inducible protein